MPTAHHDVLERRTFKAGQRIFSEGEKGGRAYIVEKGLVELSTEIDGRKTVYGTAGENSIFGEMAPFDDTQRIATAITLEPTVCIVVPASILKKKMAEADPFMQALVRVLINNVRRASSQIVDQDTKFYRPKG